MTAVLEFRHVTKRFGDHLAVDNVSLSIQEGEIFSLLGPSGCGKTTLLRMAGGFLVPDQGRILLNGEDITDLAPNKRQLNTIFQSYALFPHMTVRANIGFGPKMAGWPASQVTQEVDRLIRLVQLESEADKKPAQLSGGQKQRVALARALILKPRVLLLDEPFAALDLKLRQRMLSELERLQREVGVTFVFVTHDQHEAMSISDRIAVMRAGTLEQMGTAREIYERPCNRFVSTFIGDTNLLEGEWAEELGCPGIHVAGLPHLALPQGTKPTHNTMILSIRPEKVHVAKQLPDLVQNLNVLSGKILDKVYLGAHTRYAIDLGRHQLLSLHSHAGERQLPLEVGDIVSTWWHTSDAILLPESTAEPRQPEPPK